MRLTTLSDYALRVLMYSAASGDKLITIEETARTYGISRAHLMKVVNILVRRGFLKGVRGRSGGFMLAKLPEAIRVGDVVRATEADFALVECFATGSQCIVTGCCKLPSMLNEALNAFIVTLDKYTIADLMLKPSDFSAPTRARSSRTRGPTIKIDARA
ncbi:Rrf2 family transcriptional regulator [Pseudorhodoplanes sp.]|jgi:Rrf2 family nitric oxide-sensitive transcriptional repressor|uniref:RrF2 family transcriptional regulator n=1 Tax=Pseudorhodoplanes sp. TaxID=1934341 RepID=UPI002CF68BCE|nr:Rrf2 family transcriptional regulator [Pseudorhodoplanes sp.]HWV55098.1 Rrf2 family transcriptional regulator [Pseudorhodoplanes sp.]